MRDFGLVIVGAHVQSATHDEVRVKARSCGMNFPVVDSAIVQDGADTVVIPHCILFSQTGKCLYRGLPGAVEAPLRKAVGAALAERIGMSISGKTAVSLLDSLRGGQSPALVLKKAVQLQKYSTSETAAQVNLVIARMGEEAERRLTGDLAGEDPVLAYEQLLGMSAKFKGTPAGTKIDKRLADLKSNSAVQAELRARPFLDGIKKLDDVLSAKAARGLDPQGAEFQKAFRAPLQQMRQSLQKLRSSWPHAKATSDAEVIAEKYGMSAGETGRAPARDAELRLGSAATGIADLDAKISRLRDMLVGAGADRHQAILDEFTNAKGVEYTQALAAAIPHLAADIKSRARDALGERLTRMTQATLRERLKDGDPEIRLAAAVACGKKPDQSQIPDLIRLVADREPAVACAAGTTLRTLTGQDFGPNPGSSSAEMTAAASAWKAWWAKQKGQ